VRYISNRHVKRVDGRPLYVQPRELLVVASKAYIHQLSKPCITTMNLNTVAVFEVDKVRKSYRSRGQPHDRPQIKNATHMSLVTKVRNGTLAGLLHVSHLGTVSDYGLSPPHPRSPLATPAWRGR
jgi:hypothetical protein